MFTFLFETFKCFIIISTMILNCGRRCQNCGSDAVAEYSKFIADKLNFFAQEFEGPLP